MIMPPEYLYYFCSSKYHYQKQYLYWYVAEKIILLYLKSHMHNPLSVTVP